MDWDNVAPMIVTVTLFLSIAGVLILRPLTKRLGHLIEITSRRQQGETRQEEVTRLTEVIGRLTDRLEHLEQRQDFTDQLVVSLERPAQTRARLAEQEDR